MSTKNAEKASAVSNAIVPRSKVDLATSSSTARTILDSFFGRMNLRTAKTYREALLQCATWASSAGLLPLTPARAYKAASAEATNDAIMFDLTQLLFSWDSPTAHAHVLRYVQWMGEKGLAPSTINLRLSALKSLVRLGRMLGAITWTLDVRGVRSGRVKDVRGPDLLVMQGVLKAAKAQKDTRTYAMLVLLFERGLRGIEVRELRMPHLLLTERPPRLLVRGKGQTGFTPLSISMEAKQALEKWLLVRSLMASVVDPTMGYVFFRMGHPEEQLSKAALWSIISKFGASIGVKLWPHGLRHSAITAVLDATDGNVREVQKFSRHKNMKTVLEYDDERRDVGGELTERLSNLVKGEE